MKERFDFVSYTNKLFGSSDIETEELFLQTLLASGLNACGMEDMTHHIASQIFDRKRKCPTELFLYYMLSEHYEALSTDMDNITKTINNPYRAADDIRELLIEDDSVEPAKKEELGCFLRNPSLFLSHTLLYAMSRRQNADYTKTTEQQINIENTTFSKEQLDLAFDSCNDSQKNILQNLALSPASGISRQLFQYLGGMFLSTSVNGLLDMEWVKTTGEQNELIYLPPQVADYIMGQAAPSIQSCQFFLNNIQNICQQYGNDLCFHEELATLIESIVAHIDFNQRNISVTFMDTAISYLLKCNVIDTANSACEKLKELIVEDNQMELATYYSYAGQIAYRKQEMEQAKQLFEKGVACITPPTRETAPVLSSLYGNLSNVYRLMEDEQQAQAMLDKSMNVNTDFALQDASDTYAGKIQYAKTLSQAGQHEQARKEMLALIRQVKKEQGSENTTMAYLYHTLGTIELNMNSYDDARFHIQKAKELFEAHYEDGDTSFLPEI